MRKEDVKKICPQILFEYYEKIERNHLWSFKLKIYKKWLK